MSKEIADYLGITEEEYLELEPELEPNTGSTGEMIYNYYFYVTDEMPSHLLKKKSWKAGDFIEVPIDIAEGWSQHVD
ncbi:hypothetical protein ACR9PT_12060 [Piscirickettsia salmonis]|uniref:hypothetical protein n=1 Tax=Piscirickettsia salmonis TaxID=1238 RepID=UPI003EBF6930